MHVARAERLESTDSKRTALRLMVWAAGRGLLELPMQSFAIYYDDPISVPKVELLSEACLSLPDHGQMFFNCQTNLVETFRTLFPSGIQFVGNREIVVTAQQVLPRAELALCIEAALTYHLQKHA